MNRTVLEFLLGLRHNHLNLLVAPAENSAKKLGRVRINCLPRLHRLILANLLKLWILRPGTNGNLHLRLVPSLRDGDSGHTLRISS